MWRLDADRLLRQIQDNSEKQRLEWKPKQLLDNVFEVVGVMCKILDVRVKGEPYKIDDETYAWDYEPRSSQAGK